MSDIRQQRQTEAYYQQKEKEEDYWQLIATAEKVLSTIRPRTRIALRGPYLPRLLSQPVEGCRQVVRLAKLPE